MVGWIKLHRKFSEWEWYNKSEMVHLFIHLLVTANFEKKSWQGITVLRGQVVTGRKELSVKTGISEQSLRTCLKRLENTGEILIKSTSNYSIITVCNYESYQSEEKEINQPSTSGLTNDQPTINQQSTSGSTTTKEDKKERSKEIHTPYYAKFNFDFLEDWAKDALRKWLQYKLDLGEAYKTQAAIEQVYKKLEHLSGKNKQAAIDIVDNVIEKEAHSLFSLPEQKQQSKQQAEPIKAMSQKESDELWRQSRMQAKQT